MSIILTVAATWTAVSIIAGLIIGPILARLDRYNH